MGTESEQVQEQEQEQEQVGDVAGYVNVMRSNAFTSLFDPPQEQEQEQEMEIEKEQERVPAAFKQQSYSRSEEHPDPWPLYILGQPFNKGVGSRIITGMSDPGVRLPDC